MMPPFLLDCFSFPYQRFGLVFKRGTRMTFAQKVVTELTSSQPTPRSNHQKQQLPDFLIVSCNKATFLEIQSFNRV